MTLEEVQDEVAAHMDDIAQCFKPGVKVTVLVRTPNYPDRDFLMTNDEPDRIIEAVVRRQKTGAEPAA